MVLGLFKKELNVIETLLSGSIKDCSDIELPSLLGPGPTGLIGCVNEDLGPGTNKGFFGEVSVDELINGVDLASMIGLSAGTAQNNTDPWLKFIIDGKIYFVAKKTYRHTVSWNNIHAVNAVYGDRVIQIGDYQFKIGLLTGADSDPANIDQGNDNHPNTYRSEWTRLLYPTVTDAGTNSARHKTGQIGENWAEYSQGGAAGDLGIVSGYGRYSWCQETSSSDTARRVYRGYHSVTSSGFTIASHANNFFGWRPVLELVQPELNKPEELNGFFLGYV